jgi:hypothetical protein
VLKTFSFDPVRSATLFIALHNTAGVYNARAREESLRAAAFYARAYLHSARGRTQYGLVRVQKHLHLYMLAHSCCFVSRERFLKA